MRNLLLSSAAALTFAGLASAQTFTLTGDETVTISGEATLGEIWLEQTRDGNDTNNSSSYTDVDLDMVIEGDGWTLEADSLESNFSGDVSLLLDSGLFATSDLTDFVDTVPESYLMYEGFTAGVVAPEWADDGGEGNHTRDALQTGAFYETRATGAIGFQSNGLTLALGSEHSSGGLEATLGAALELGGIATVAAQMNHSTLSTMLSIETGGLLLELAYWSWDDPDNNTLVKLEQTAFTFSYAVEVGDSEQTFSLSYRPEREYTIKDTQPAAGDYTGSEIITLKYEGDFDGFGIEVGMMDWPEADIWVNGFYLRGGSSSSVVLTFDLAENVELGIGYVQGEEGINVASADAEPNQERTRYDIGISVEF